MASLEFPSTTTTSSGFRVCIKIDSMLFCTVGAEFLVRRITETLGLSFCKSFPPSQKRESWVRVKLFSTNVLKFLLVDIYDVQADIKYFGTVSDFSETHYVNPS